VRNRILGAFFADAAAALDRERLTTEEKRLIEDLSTILPTDLTPRWVTVGAPADAGSFCAALAQRNSLSPEEVNSFIETLVGAGVLRRTGRTTRFSADMIGDLILAMCKQKGARAGRDAQVKGDHLKQGFPVCWRLFDPACRGRPGGC